MSCNLFERPFIGIALMLCLILSSTRAASAEFLAPNLLDDPWPEPAFAHEVEVKLLPVMQFQVLDEEMPVTLTMRNLSHGNVRLPHGWGNGFLCDVWFKIDPEFAAQHGIRIRESGAFSISAFVKRLSPGETAHTIINLRCYLTFTRPIRSPVPVTWRLELRTGEEKNGHFILRVNAPRDQWDEIWENTERAQIANQPRYELEPPWEPPK